MPNLVTMKVNTAIAFLLAALSLRLRQARASARQRSAIAQLCAAMTAAIGLLTLTQYLFHWNLGIDQLLFTEASGAVGTSQPGRMAPSTALNFLLLGIALWFPSHKPTTHDRAIQLLTLLALLISIQAVVGYFYGVEDLYAIATYTQMALHTGLTFVVLSLGVLFASPHWGLMQLVTQDSLGGFIARQLLLAAVVIPLLLGWLIIQGQHLLWFDSFFGLSLLVVLTIVILTAMIWRTSASLDHVDADRQCAKAALQQAYDELEQLVAERTAALTQANADLTAQIAISEASLQALLQSEAALQQRKQELRAILDHTPDVIIRCDRQYRYVYVNPAVEQATGIPASALVGKTSRDLGSPEALYQFWETTLQQVFDTGKEVAIEFLAPTVTGLRTYQSRVVPEADADGTIRHALVVSRDISELKQAQKQIQREKEFSERLINSSVDGILAFDRNCCYTVWNPGMERLTGVSKAEVLGESAFDVPFLCEAGADQPFQAVLAGQTLAAGERHYLIPATGEQGYFEGYYSPLYEESGEIVGGLGIIRDVTERQKAEAERAELVQAQAARVEAEAANQLKDEFLAVLSHELRTPMSSILGWARLLRTRQFDQKTIDRALETIERNAELQTQLIEDMIDVSRMIQGKLRLGAYPVDLICVLDGAIEAVRPSAEAKAIAVDFVNPMDEPVEANLSPTCRLLLYADPIRLQQAFWHLLSNAVKFTPAAGRITVRLSALPPDQVQVEIIDTGQGINPEFLPYVFDRFRQADSSTTRAHGGLGLGLAIVRHLVELHGGQIRVDSPGEGKGAVFTVILPLLAQGENSILSPARSHLLSTENPSSSL
jgi:PAS domain S-box-containing protein